MSGRRFLGIEKNEKFVKAAKRRLELVTSVYRQ
jgi:DNA modification methylase